MNLFRTVCTMIVVVVERLTRVREHNYYILNGNNCDRSCLFFHGYVTLKCTKPRLLVPTVHIVKSTNHLTVDFESDTIRLVVAFHSHDDFYIATNVSRLPGWIMNES